MLLGTPLQQSTGTVLQIYGHSGPVKTAVWSPDGKTIVSSGSDNMVIAWNVTTGGIIKYLSSLELIKANSSSELKWSKSGEMLAVMNSTSLRVYNQSYDPLYQFKPLNSTMKLEALGWVANDLIVSVSNGTLYRYSPSQNKSSQLVNLHQAVESIEVSSAEDRIAILLTNRSVIIMNALNPNLTTKYNFESTPSSMTWQGQSLLVTEGHRIQMIDSSVHIFDLGIASNVTALTKGVNQTHVIIGTSDGVIYSYAFATRTTGLIFNLTHSLGSKERINHLDLRGENLLITSDFRVFYSMDLQTGKLAMTFGGDKNLDPSASFINFQLFPFLIVFLLIVPLKGWRRGLKHR